MRYILASLSFAIAAICLWYCATIVLFLHREVGLTNIDFAEDELRFGLIVLGGSFVMGMAFIAGGIAALRAASRRNP